ncbi:MAG: diguanylate cyclase domain-containing protein [Acidimicrobiales bacterium]
MQHEAQGEPGTRFSATLARHLAPLASVFDATPIAMGVWSLEGELMQANPVFRDLFDLPVAEVVGRRFESYLDAADAPDVQASLQDLLDGKRNYFECDFRCARPDDGTHWVRTMVTAVYGPTGRPDYLLSQVFDFANPRTSKTQTRRLVNETPVMLWLTDTTGWPRVGNRTSFEFLGGRPDEDDLGDLVFRAVHAEDLAEVADGIVQNVEARVPFEFTVRVARADGRYRWLHHRALPFFDSDGSFEGYAGASLDVTEAEELRRELDDVRQLFQTVTDAGPLAVLRTDPDGNIVSANGSWPSLLEEVRQLPGLNWRSILAPEHVDEIVTLGLASITSREPFTVRVRTVDPEAGIDDIASLAPDQTWGELRVAPVFAEDGTHEGFVATLADVSAEVAAGTRADRLARVLEAGSDFLMIAERDGAISFVNDAAQQTLGVSGSSVGGTPSFLMDVLDADSFEAFQEVVEPALAADGIWRGELTFRSRSGAPIPVSALFLAHENHLGRLESISAVARDITDLKDAERRLRQLATHDYLTGLPNRVLLYDRLEQALARFHRHGQPVALLYLDLDRFKPINDELGHQVGDAVLVEIGVRIHTVIRETDTAARIGGDEFAVLVEGMEDPVMLRLVADRLIDAISAPMEVRGHEVQVGASIGLVVAGSRASEADALMAAADAAMYRAKAAGRGRYEFVGQSLA